MELWQWVEYYAPENAFMLFIAIIAIVCLCRDNVKLSKKIKEQEAMIQEMDEFIENNSRVWQ